MGNSIAEARDRSHSSPRISFARKFRGSTASGRGNNHNDSDSSSRGSTLTICSEKDAATLSASKNKQPGLRENRSSQNLQTLEQQKHQKETKQPSPGQTRKFFDEHQGPQKPRASTTTATTTSTTTTSLAPVAESIKAAATIGAIVKDRPDTLKTKNHMAAQAQGPLQQPDFQIRGPVSLRPKTNPIYDDYIITKQVLGLGISGKVISCTHKKTNVKYALKTLRDSQKARREIDLQWRACQGCKYIVQIIDVYENVINNQKVFLIVMECMEGGELFAKISERTHPFTEQEVAKIMHQICAAVKHLHTMRIVHRDLKPENLLLSSNDETAIIKLTDFGFAKEVSLGLATPCYTPYYVAPEVLGSDRYDISCDIWSLGVIMYILCCGYPPFYSTHGQPISPGMKRRIKAGEYAFPDAEWSRVSQEAKDLIAGMLETIPEKRSTIDDIVNSNWISRYYNVPQTPLPSVDILKEDKDNWVEVQANMRMALDEMRINWDPKALIKLDPTKNKLFEKRTKKNKPGEDTTADSSPKKSPPTTSSTANAPENIVSRRPTEPMIVEDLSREASTVTMRNESRSNSRPPSPK